MKKSKITEYVFSIANVYAQEIPNKQKMGVLYKYYVFCAILKVMEWDDSEILEAVNEVITTNDYLKIDECKKEMAEARLYLKTQFKDENINYKLARENLRNYINHPKSSIVEVADKEILDALANDIAWKMGLFEVSIFCYLKCIFSKLSRNLDCNEIFGFKEMYDKPFAKLYELAQRKEKLKVALLSEIVGQDDAVEEFVQGLIDSQVHKKEGTKPAGVFVFAGPPGCGKTFLATTLAKIYEAEGGKVKCKRFDMSEYSDKVSPVDLIGSNRVYKDARPGALTSFVHDNRDYTRIIIFDEIEKAHINVIHLFLQILDAGTLRDMCAEITVDFKDTYIIFTTNAGRSIYENDKKCKLTKQTIIEALGEDINPETKAPYFPSAILSRMNAGYPIMFNQLSANQLVEIGRKRMKYLADKYKVEYDLNITVDENIPFMLLLRHGGECDARSFAAECEKFLDKELFSLTEQISVSTFFDVMKNNNRIHINAWDTEVIDSLYDECDMDVVVIRFDDSVVDEETALIYGALIDYGINVIEYSVDENICEEIRSGKIKPSIVIFDMPNIKATKTMYFASKAPLMASYFDEFNDIIEELKKSDSKLVLCALIDKKSWLNIDLEEDLYRVGISKVFDKESTSAYMIYSLLEEYKLEQVTFKCAREHKCLNFDVVPAQSEEGIEILLKNMELETVISGKDMSNYVDRMPTVKFEDYIGGETIKDELKEFIEFLSNPSKYMLYGKPMPRGVLLYGPPGTGKTFLAKALANEAKVPFFAVNGSEFMNTYVGEGSKNVRELFRKAKKYSPSIVFIDEVDSIARVRSGEQSNAERESTLNMLLSEMDGFGQDPMHPVFVVAATNANIKGERMVLDSAFVRRFTRTVFVDLPNKDDRRVYLERALRKYWSDIDGTVIDSVAKRSTGMNYSDLENVVELAWRKSDRNLYELDSDVLNDALETIRFGEKKDWDKAILERVAWHEMGHAYINYKHGSTPEYITITARGDFGGYVMPADEEKKAIYTKQEIMNIVDVCMAGRAAEIVRYGKECGISSGASQDLEKAKAILVDYICSFGMDEKLGYVYEEKGTMSEKIKLRIAELLVERLEEVCNELNANKVVFEVCVEKLLERNNLMKHEIEEMLGGNKNDTKSIE